LEGREGGEGPLEPAVAALVAGVAVAASGMVSSSDEESEDEEGDDDEDDEDAEEEEEDSEAWSLMKSLDGFAGGFLGPGAPGRVGRGLLAGAARCWAAFASYGLRCSGDKAVHATVTCASAGRG